MIGIVSYGSGNIDALGTVFRKAHVPFLIAATPAELDRADRILLPGVGTFDAAMEELERSGLRSALDRAVRRERKPVLGICVGMQLLARSSEEGVAAGLGWIDGTVRRFDHAQFHQATHLPHMGWNTVECRRPTPLFHDIPAGSEFYFLHSYHFASPDVGVTLATTCYGASFTSAVHQDNIFGVQFHPEKSHQAGVTLLRNFATAEL